MAWLIARDIEPTLTNWYQMQETVEVRRLNYILGGKCPDLHPKDFLLKVDGTTKPLSDADRKAKSEREFALLKAWAEAPILRKRLMAQMEEKRQKGKAEREAARVDKVARRAPQGNGRKSSTPGKATRIVPIRQRRCEDEQS